MISANRPKYLRSFISYCLMKLSNYIFTLSIFIGNRENIENSYLYRDNNKNIRIKYRSKSEEYETFLSEFLELETSIYKNIKQMKLILKQIPELLIDNVQYKISIDTKLNKFLVFNNDNLIAEYSTLLELLKEIDIIQNICEASYKELLNSFKENIKNRKSYNDL